MRLRRAFGFDHVPRFDPFLMLDDFSSDDPDDYRAGFPWHPHRGIETVTYLLKGRVTHGDSIGNSGTIGPGDVQWMTAGSGIVHQEMPQPTRGGLAGFQLWVNLPARDKLTTPRYRDVAAASIPVVTPVPGVKVRVIAGEIAGVRGPVRDIVVDPEYLDVSLRTGVAFAQPMAHGLNGFCYVVEGAVSVGGRTVAAGSVALLGAGDLVRLQADEVSRVLLVSGRPLGEPVAWRGPIVMNTEQELDVAFDEYRRGDFIKHGKDPEE